MYFVVQFSLFPPHHFDKQIKISISQWHALILQHSDLLSFIFTEIHKSPLQ